MASKSENKIRVVVVDDSAFMRKALSMMIESDDNLVVVGTARDGEEAIEKVKSLKPDIVTLDVEMPRVNGLVALKEIMASCPVPVLMVSSATNEGAETTLDALELGAVDFIPKKLSYVSLDIVKIKDELLSKIKNIASRKHILMARFKCASTFKAIGNDDLPPITHSLRRDKFYKLHPERKTQPINVIGIGCSTGGPMALQHIIPRLPRSLPCGVIVAQHMPAAFTASLAERLNGLSNIEVVEAKDGDIVTAGVVYIAPGGKHLAVKRKGSKAIIKISEEPSEILYRPSVDIMMKSLVVAFGKFSMGVILTGMGQDGLDGLKDMKVKGGVIIAQEEKSCVVYGMPKAIVDANLTDHISPLDKIANEISSYF